jgi:2-polyprenyl-3-methyl-5-hydroxy-6-metoxy-1,4-benzoquinol methylase
MEVMETQIPWLDKTHPNYNRWKSARDISVERGRFVKSILKQVTECNNLTILDIGSGEGGTSRVLSENNSIISLDISKERLSRQSEQTNKIVKLCGSAHDLPFNKNSFDVIILQDVIEHLSEKNNFSETIHHLLKDDGIIYLSTPNKYSIINFLSDPHWGIPIISVLNRDNIRKYFLRYFRKSEVERKDIAELISVKELFNRNKGIIWSNFHLKLIKITSFLKLDNLLIKIVNDKPGLLNRLFTPTFYLILKKI